MNDKLKELLEKRNSLLQAAQALMDKANTEKRSLSESETSDYDGKLSEIESLDVTIEQEKRSIRLSNVQKGHEDFLKQNAGSAHKPNPDLDDLSKQEKRDLSNFSYVRLIRSQLPGFNLEGIEAEVAQEAAIEARNNGIALEGVGVPQKVLAHSRRDLAAEGSSAGAELVATGLGSIVDVFREKLRVKEMGATVLSDLVGNLVLPKMGRGSSPSEKGETAAADEYAATTSKISFAPERLPTVTEVTSQMLRQDSSDVEAWLRGMLGFELASIMDKRAINGSGSSNQPTGILQTSGIGAVAMGTNGAVPDWSSIVKLETEVAVDNADEGKLGYLTNAKVRGKMKETEKFSSTGQLLWPSDNRLNGYRAEVSNNVPSNLTKGSASGVCSAAIFGNWADLVIAQWGGIDFLLNPYSKDETGLIRLNAWTFYDLGVTRPESFAAVQDYLTT